MTNKEMKLLSDINDKSSVSARVNSFIAEQYRESEIPISLVIESSLIYFMKLSDADKIKFISGNLPEKVRVDEIKVPRKKWKDMLADYFKKLSVPSSVTTGLFAGISVGAVAVLGGILSTLGDKLIDDEL